MKWFIGVAMLMILLTGCAPILKVSTPRTVMLGNVDQFNSARALQMAEAECMKHNRHAVEIPDNIRDGNSSYECKD
jgi:hypothetical protein